MLETVLSGALVSLGRTVQRAAGVVRRGLPANPGGRPSPARGRSGGRRPGSTEARRTPAVRKPVAGVTVLAPVGPRHAEILTPEALAFLADLHRRFDARRRALAVTHEPSGPASAGSALRIDALPPDLAAQCVAASDRAGLIDAVKRDAAVLADFASADEPVWANNLEGQINLRELWAGSLGPKPAALVARPRRWAATEEHLCIDDQPVAGALFDAGLYAFHNAQAAHAQGAVLCFALPEAERGPGLALWADVFAFAETALALPAGSIQASSAP
jgi:malate synthase